MMYGGYQPNYGGQQQDPYAGRMLAPFQNRVQPVAAPNATPPQPLSVPPFPTSGGGGGNGGVNGMLSAVAPAVSAGTSLFGMFGDKNSTTGNTQGGQSSGGGMDWGTIASLAGIAAMFLI